MIQERLAPSHRLLLVGAVRGLVAEVASVLKELESFGPESVGIGLSSEELQGLNDYFVTSEAEPVVPLTSTEVAEVTGLGRFGEVKVPNPSNVAVLAWARDRGIPVKALDPSDEQYASLFAENIGYLELVRRTVTERGLTKRAPPAATPDEFALAWDGAISDGRGSRRFAAARDSALADAAVRLGGRGGRVAVIVDRERYALIRTLLDERLARTL